MPNATGTQQIINDSTLYNNYVVAGYTVKYLGGYHQWNDTNVIGDITITQNGITAYINSDVTKNVDIYVILVKIT